MAEAPEAPDLKSFLDATPQRSRTCQMCVLPADLRAQVDGLMAEHHAQAKPVPRAAIASWLNVRGQDSITPAVVTHHYATRHWADEA